jgi:hypothetical protein
MTGTMAVCALGALGVYLLVVRPAERRSGVRHGGSDDDVVAATTIAA